MFYDIVELPSLGVFYEGINPYVKVNYITTQLELNLTSTNTFRNKIVCDVLLNECIEDKKLLEVITEYDREAILLFLYSTAYGSEITFKDKEDKENFIDLIENGILRNPSNLVGRNRYYCKIDEYEFVYKINSFNSKKINKLLYGKESQFYDLIESILEINEDSDKEMINYFVFNKSIPMIRKLKKIIKDTEPRFDLNLNLYNEDDHVLRKYNLNINDDFFNMNENHYTNVMKEIEFLHRIGEFSLNDIYIMTISQRRFFIDDIIKRNNK